MRVYHATRIDPTTGERVPYGHWLVKYKDANGRLRNVSTGCNDKAAAMQKAAMLVRQAERVRAGLADPHEEEARRPLTEHLAEFETVLSARGRTPGHVHATVARVRKIVEGARARTSSDLRPARVETFLGELRRDGLSAQSVTHYVRAVKEFSHWLVLDGRLGEDPLACLVAASDVEADRRLVRRALVLDEAVRLLDAAAGSSMTVEGLTGKEREALYLTAMRTGLRARELASLTKGSLNLDGTPATVTIEAASAKNRRTRVLPLHPDVVDVLRALVSPRPFDSFVWPGKWCGHAARMLRVDLAAAGIPFEESGQVLDFHALRHSCGTLAAQSGMHPRLAQELMRHSDINLTMRRYTHPQLLDLAVAVEKMPRLRPRARETHTATGTEGDSGASECVPRCVLSAGSDRDSRGLGGTPRGTGGAKPARRKRTACDTLGLGRTRVGRKRKKAASGFEPENDGFANHCLSRLATPPLFVSSRSLSLTGVLSRPLTLRLRC